MIDVLTSLRAVFAFLVFMSHWGMIDDNFDSHVFFEGYVGVSFFFVLSGFIIAYNYEDRFLQGLKKKNFYIARFARIYPLHILTTLLSAVLFVFPVVIDNLSFLGIANAMGKFVLNLCLLQAYIPESVVYFSYNSPSWSLCCEQLFYLLCPFVFVKFRKTFSLGVIILLVIVLMSFGMWITPENRYNDFWYVNPVLRFPEFLLGVLVYRIYKIRRPNWPVVIYSLIEILCIALFIGFYIMAEYVPLVYRCSVYYMLPIALLILVFSWSGGAVSKIFSNKIFIWLGETSYGFYLYHFILVSLVIRIFNMFELDCEPWLGVLIIFVLTLFVSGISYSRFEKPVNKWIKNKLLKA